MQTDIETTMLALIVSATPAAESLRQRGRCDLADAVHAVRAHVHGNEGVEQHFAHEYKRSRVETCTRCNEPTYASESNDRGECSTCAKSNRPALYLRNVSTKRGGMMGSVMIDCVDYPAKAIASTLRQMLTSDDDESDDERYIENTIEMLSPTRLLFHEACALELSEQLHDVLCGACGEDVDVLYVEER